MELLDGELAFYTSPLFFGRYIYINLKTLENFFCREFVSVVGFEVHSTGFVR
jgi:hypothetical protein